MCRSISGSQTGRALPDRNVATACRDSRTRHKTFPTTALKSDTCSPPRDHPRSGVSKAECALDGPDLCQIVLYPSTLPLLHGQAALTRFLRSTLARVLFHHQPAILHQDLICRALPVWTSTRIHFGARAHACSKIDGEGREGEGIMDEEGRDEKNGILFLCNSYCPFKDHLNGMT